MKLFNYFIHSDIKLFLIFLLGISLSLSCKKLPEIGTTDPEETFEELAASNSFKWQLNNQIDITVSGAAGIPITITDQYDSLVYNKGVTNENTYYASISIPSFIDTISINKQSIPVSATINYQYPTPPAGLKSLKAEASTIAFGDRYVFNNRTSTDYNNAIYLKDNTFIIVYQSNSGSKGNAVIATYEEDVISYGESSQFGGSSSGIHARKLSDDKIIVAYEDSGDGYKGRTVIGTINGSSISWSEPMTFHDDKVDFVNVVVINESKVVYTFSDENNSDYGTVVIGNISGSSIAFESKIVFHSDQSDHIHSAELSNGYIAIVFQDEHNGRKGTAISGLIEENSITWGTPAVFYSSSSTDLTMGRLSDNSFVIALRAQGHDNNGTAIIGSADNNVLSFGELSTFNEKKCKYTSIATNNGTDVVISYSDYNNSRKGTIIRGTVSDKNIEWENEMVFNGKTNYTSVTFDSNSDVIVVYRDFSTSDRKSEATKTYSVKDTDGDGVNDHEDDDPNNANNAFTNTYPSGTYGTLGFEDLWPKMGDYDFNDLVISYFFEGNSDASNNVTEIKATFVVKATGAGFSNGFGFELPGANVTQSDINVTGYKTPQNGIVNLSSNGLEAGQSNITIIPYSIVPKVGNTTIGGYSLPYDTCVITISVVNGSYSFDDFGFNKFNPFLIVNEERGKEVHLPSPNYNPTSLVDDSYFGTSDDDSNPQISRYYRTVNNMPWAINIPYDFDYPIEREYITSAYLMMKNWITSDGNEYQDWYLDKDGYRDDSKIYSK